MKTLSKKTLIDCTQEEKKVKLQDIIEFELPFGILGKLLLPLIQRDIENMFEYRHQQTKKILEQGKQNG